MQYQFDCSAFGQSGNFVLSTEDQNGQPVLGGVEVNRLAMNGSGTVDGYNILGGEQNSHIAVISECSWSLTVLKMST